MAGLKRIVNKYRQQVECGSLGLGKNLLYYICTSVSIERNNALVKGKVGNSVTEDERRVVFPKQGHEVSVSDRSVEVVYADRKV